MSNDILGNVWPEWQIEKQLGKGSYGVVYQAVRNDHDVESHAAIKVITIPSDEAEIDSLRAEGLDISGTKTYLSGIVRDFVNEIQLMQSLKGVQNIVSVEDYKVIEKTDTIGWNIYIRMELLTPFPAYTFNRQLTEAEVIKLGSDICTAIEMCERRNIIHRDIKPENIFINDFNDYKLGDFGIARKLENVTGGLSQKGTFNYMAPEVANSAEYDTRVDIYSLGLVLYRLLNNNRLPFIENEQQLMSPNERRAAVERRIRGEALPPPAGASPMMAHLILRACAFDPNRRFANAAEMKQALFSVANGTYQIVPNQVVPSQIDSNELDKTVSVRRAPGAAAMPGQFGQAAQGQFRPVAPGQFGQAVPGQFQPVAPGQPGAAAPNQFRPVAGQPGAAAPNQFPAAGQFTPAAQGQFTPAAQGQFTPAAQGQFAPAAQGQFGQAAPNYTPPQKKKSKGTAVIVLVVVFVALLIAGLGVYGVHKLLNDDTPTSTSKNSDEASYDGTYYFYDALNQKCTSEYIKLENGKWTSYDPTFFGTYTISGSKITLSYIDAGETVEIAGTIEVGKIALTTMSGDLQDYPLILYLNGQVK